MKHLFDALGKWIHDHAKLTLSVIAIITVILGVGLTKITMNTGNSMFVPKSSKVSKDTETYQKHFGSDTFIIDISKSNDSTVTPKTFKKVNKFINKANDIKGIRSTTSVINIMNAELNGKGSSSISTNGSNAKLQSAMMSSLSSKQQKDLQTKLTKMMTTAQQAKIQTYTMSILTTAQKQQMAMAQASGASQAQLSGSLTKALNKTQQEKVQAYSQSLLTSDQKAQLTKSVINDLPDVQNMNADLLHQLIYSNDGKIPSQFDQLLPKNGHHLLVSMTTNDKTTMTSNNVQYLAIKHQLKKSGLVANGYHARIAGTPAISGTVGAQMTRSMAIMLVAAVIIMIVILSLVFPVRRRLLPLVNVLFGMVWTFGLMGWLHIEITMATMATLPILIGLGTDFGVQFLNRYEEEYKKNGQDVVSAIQTTAAHSGVAVGTATIVMFLSFLTMLISKAPMLKFFGVTLALGVVICYIVEFFMSFSILSIMEHRSSKKGAAKLNQNRSWLNTALSKYAKWVMKHALIITIVGVVLGGVGFYFESKVAIETDMTKMIPQNMPALKANKKVIKEVGSTTNLTYLVKGDHITSKSSMAAMNQFENDTKDKYGSKILSVTSLSTTLPYKSNLSQSALNQKVQDTPHIIKQNLLSSNEQYATISFKIDPDLKTDQALKLMNHITKDAKNVKGSLTISPAGSTTMMLKGINNMTANHELIIIAGLAIIFIVLMLIYRHLHYAIYPLLPIVIVLGLSPLTLYLLGISYNPVTIALSSLILGIGTEFTILVLERYIEERRAGMDNAESIETALGSVGQAITVSGLTVIGGFSTLMFVNFPILHSFGLITVLDTAYALISTLTILPAVVYLFRPRNKKKPEPKQVEEAE